jgi:hypothetical protein
VVAGTTDRRRWIVDVPPAFGITSGEAWFRACQRSWMVSRNARYSGVCTAAIGSMPQSGGSTTA